ncbi:DUF3293 domain-containing protein [Photobacterium galatheae]|uniref:DUF3293 domain-containing protein n=1 Tax=Photobacterium galatheae TaxID=1654360 RepID=A0A066RMS9_9GAMM|nr:DUF3293 domain-containing protein [Photobacterium galatheae]KDM90441.1 hypothetical protein EA58_17090 [Photobacterium galatheae]MCM0147839.1 DUF3293 domain-containing protein [Photobacterium galatheae]
MAESSRQTVSHAMSSGESDSQALYRLWQNYQQIIFRADQALPFTTFAILTAFNPESIVLSCKENHQRQASLEAALFKLGYSFQPLDCSAPDGSWHEPSLAVAIDMVSARKIAARWHQNALYWVTQQQLTLVPVLLEKQGLTPTVLGAWQTYLHIEGSA